MSTNTKPIGTYPPHGGGFAAYDKEARAWRITEDEAKKIKEDRK